MNYGDFTITGASRKEIDDILSTFRIPIEDVLTAVDAVRIHTPKLAWSYYFICDCINMGQEIVDEIVRNHEAEVLDMYEDIHDLGDEIYERSEAPLPIQTYVQWMVWVDLTPDYAVPYDNQGDPYESSDAAIGLFEWSRAIIEDYVFGYLNTLHGKDIGRYLTWGTPPAGMQ